jgi:hypothetical protein
MIGSAFSARKPPRNSDAFGLVTVLRREARERLGGNLNRRWTQIHADEIANREWTRIDAKEKEGTQTAKNSGSSISAHLYH